MDPMLVITTIQVSATAISDVCKLLLSPEGQKAMAQWNEDAKELRRVVNAVGTWFEQTFKFQVVFVTDENGNLKADIKAIGGK